MPGKASVTDRFANMATINNIESAANTLTFKKLETSFGTFEKVAWIIHRIEYYLNSPSTAWNGTDDTLTVALTVSNSIASLITGAAITDPAIIDQVAFGRFDWGAAASGIMVEKPFVHDFTSMPSGGLIIPPAPLYGAIQGSGMASVGLCTQRIYYTIKQLATDEYWELVEARRLLTA